MKLDKGLKELRVVLDSAATNAFENMVARMKEDQPTVKVQPSHFVSFLVSEFFAAYFDKDRAVLIAEFFDSDAFYEAARRKAKGSSNYEDQMTEAMEAAQKIRGKKRRKAGRGGPQANNESEPKAP